MLRSFTQQDAAIVSARKYHRLLAAASDADLLNRDAGQVARVRTITTRLTAQATVFRADASTWQWEANVATSPRVNAWCMAGGKIVVFTGLLDLGLSDDELAAVLGHEIAHGLREHTREAVRSGRQFEIEADMIGVELAARAGYDPRAALTLWAKVSAAAPGRARDWMAAHPTDDLRVQALNRAIVEVMPLYEAYFARNPR